ncbi:hypothetical protein DXG03_007972 [Asterophora parasitica]|uniref:Uncharacterized protein n=1 Tax=Asterophora parasitica TaxID=117018 RepID=A0A9P7G9J5_9AGAR|nr:hypothetical protein DXG03_007972 [Asterophora parasitica]
MPQPPASHITKRRRSAKLLGESALDKVVYSPQRSSSITGTKAMEVVGGLGERLTYLRAAIKVGRILDSASDEDSIEEEAEKSQDFGDYSWHLENGTVFRDTSDQRDSRKWIREKGGKRWEEHDYQAIISALRAL